MAPARQMPFCVAEVEMKTLEAVISMWWSLTAVATLYVVLHRPAVQDARAVRETTAACQVSSGPVMLRVLAPGREPR